MVETAATTTANAALALRPGVGTASIGGIVTTSLGEPLPGVSVYVTGPASGDGYSDDSGHYTITDLPTGDYTVLFVDNAAFEYQFEWWDDAASETEAIPVPVADGAHVDGIDASLDKMDAAFISGQVSGADGSPIEGIRVVAQSSGSGSGDIATTASDGTYTLEVSAGEFVIGFEPPGDTPWFAEFYDNAFDVIDASVVSVAAGETRTGIDTQLDRAGLITGRVTAGGEPAADVHVTGSSTGGLVEAWTNADGVYALVVPNPGAYRLRFERQGDDLRPEWFDDARQVGDSTPVSVEHSTTVSGIDVDLEPGGSISGRVTDTAGEPVAGFRVVASGGGSSTDVTTDGDGRYTIDGLDGSVVLAASPGWGSEFAPRYWPDAPSFGSAGSIVVDGDVYLTGYDITVRRLGSITGTVSSPGGPTPNARVVLHPTGDGFDQTAWTGEDGRYSFEQLGLGDYVVEFTEAAEQHLLGEHWNGAPDRASAAVLSITDGERFEHIDADLDPAGVLSGRVTDEAADPVPFLELAVSGSLSGSAVFTDADGRYEAHVRPAPGTVRVVSDDVVNATHEYASVAPGDAATLDLVVGSGVSLGGSLIAPDGIHAASAEVFVYSLNGHGLAGAWLWGPGGYQFAHVPAGEVEIRVSAYACAAQCISVQFRETIWLTAGANTFDFVIPEPGEISGRVTDDAGEPVANRAVLACVDESGCVNQHTDDDGRFVFDGLLPADYEVRAVEIVDPWVEIRTVTVEPGAVSTADFVLPRLVTVSGTLRSSSGTPMATGAAVSARDRDTGEVIRYGEVGADGVYELNVASGVDVAVCVETTDAYGGTVGGGFECWDNAASVGAATPLSGSPGSVLSDIDFTLGGPSVIGGLEADVDDDSVTVTWDAPLYTGGRSITNYVVQVESGDGVWVTYDDGVSTARTVTVSGLGRGVTHRFRVAAVNAFGVGVASDPVSVDIPPTVPSAPLHLTATRVPGRGGPLIELSWDPPADDGGADVVDYVIQRSPNGRSRWETIADGTSAATTYTVTRADDGRGRHFRVIAVNAVGAGPPSEVVTARR